MWAISTRMDPARDITVIENTPIDYLDFASPESGPGLEDRPGRHQQVAARDPPRMGREAGYGPRHDRRGHGEVGEAWPARRWPAGGIWAKRRAWTLPPPPTPPPSGPASTSSFCWCCRCWSPASGASITSRSATAASRRCIRRSAPSATPREYIPAALAGLGLLALAGAPPMLIHPIGLVLFVGRLLHAVGLSRIDRHLAGPGAPACLATWIAYVAIAAALLFYADPIGLFRGAGSAISRSMDENLLHDVGRRRAEGRRRRRRGRRRRAPQPLDHRAQGRAGGGRARGVPRPGPAGLRRQAPGRRCPAPTSPPRPAPS